jgi:K+-transporting ATPase KdpF subunit
MRAEQERADHVGRRMHHRQHCLLSAEHRLYRRLRQPAGKGEALMLEIALLSVVTSALFVYLVYALLRPEKF